jgi:alpha-1,3-glucosyltransferase
LALCLKLLLIPAYFSTDFDVHRNWLAITHHVSPSRWYWDKTSVWTLDYPPLFAYFQWLLGKAALIIFRIIGKQQDAGDLLALTAEPIRTPAVIVFQRLSVVIVSDGLLYLGICFLEAVLRVRHGKASLKPLYWLLLLHPGLVLVDNIHFQYNGMLFGLMLMAVGCAYAGKPVLCGLAFLALVLTKHLFLVLGPVVVAYLLASTLFKDENSYPRAGGKTAWAQLGQLAFGSISLIIAAFAPVVLPAAGSSSTEPLASAITANLRQIFTRLFPFHERGLVHSYWAPNLWALYMTADKVLSVKGIGCRLLGLCGPKPDDNSTGSPVDLPPNAVNSSSFLQSLPLPSPRLCTAMTLLAALPVAVLVFRRVRAAGKSTSSSGDALLLGCVLSYACNFLFGWHTHEKAILYVTVPLLMLLVVQRNAGGDGDSSFLLAGSGRRAIWCLHLASCLCLFPLIFTSLEQPFIIAHAAVYSVAFHLWLNDGEAQMGLSPLLPRLLQYSFYGGAAVALLFLESCYAEALPICSRLPFAPLMLVSVVCGISISASLLHLYKQALGKEETLPKAD